MATRLGDHRFDDQLDDRLDRRREAVARPRPQGTGRSGPEVLGSTNSRSRRPDRLRNLPPSSRAHDLARRNVSSVRGRPARLRLVRHRERLSLADAVVAAQGRSTSRTRWRAWPRSRRCSISRDLDSRPAPRVKVETAIKQTEGAIGFYADELFKLAGEKPDHNELSLKAERIVASLNRLPGFSQDRRVAPLRATTGGSARTCSRTSSISSSTPGSPRRKCSPRPSARRRGSNRRWR